LREVLVHKFRAPGDPYDFGRFELAVQPWSDEAPAPSPRSLPIVRTP
jgi:hypothetical protein